MLTLLMSMFALGLATSVHCVSMCGPMVVTYAVSSPGDGGWRANLLSNFTYHGAKIVSYALVGLALGAVGAAFNLNGARPWVMLGAGLFMVVLGLGMTGRVPWAARLTPRPPKALVTALSKLRRRATTHSHGGHTDLATPAAFGLLTGLMPCAPLQAAELAAASSGGAVSGGLAMLAFGVGTMPLLFAFGAASGLIPARLKQQMAIVLAVVVIGLGFVFLDRAAMLVGFPANSGAIRAALSPAPTPSTTAAYTMGKDGVVEVPLEISGTEYHPSTLRIPADRRVRIVVTRNEDVGCSAQIAFPQLRILKDLVANGVTVVELPPTPAGTYTMTCGMAMMSGQLVVGDSAITRGPTPLIWIAIFVAAVGAGVAVVVWRRRQTRPAAGRQAGSLHGREGTSGLSAPRRDGGAPNPKDRRKGRSGTSKRS